MSNYWDDVSWEKTLKTKKKFYESELLRLNCNKAKKILRWESSLKFEESMQMVATWYRNYYLSHKDIEQVTKKQIKNYQYLVAKRGANWIKNF